VDSGLLQQLIDEDFGYKHEGRNWGRSVEHSSLVLNEESQHWYWNSENMGGTAVDYFVLIRHLKKPEAEKKVEYRNKIVSGSFFDTTEPIAKVPYEKLVDLFWELGKGNREYWYDRKLTDKTIDRYRLGFFDGWNLVPLYVGNSFVNFQCRRDFPTRKMKLWYRIPNWQPVLLNPELLSLVDTIFITEGLIDSILLNQEGMPSVSHTGGSGHWNSEWFHYFNKVKNVYYIADNDDAGRQAAYRVAKSLGMDKVRIYEFDNKPEKFDTVDYFREGITGKEFRAEIEANSKYLFETQNIYETKRRKYENRSRP